MDTTLSETPSASPTNSVAPTITQTNVPISTFDLAVSTSTNSAVIDDNELEDILHLYLLQQLSYELPNKYELSTLQLELVNAGNSKRELITQAEHMHSEEFVLSRNLTFDKEMVPSTDELDSVIMQSLTEHGADHFLALLAEASDPALQAATSIELSIFKNLPIIGGATYYEKVAESKTPLLAPLVAVALICSLAMASIFIVTHRRRLRATIIQEKGVDTEVEGQPRTAPDMASDAEKEKETEDPAEEEGTIYAFVDEPNNESRTGMDVVPQPSSRHNRLIQSLTKSVFGPKRKKADPSEGVQQSKIVDSRENLAAEVEDKDTAERIEDKCCVEPELVPHTSTRHNRWMRKYKKLIFKAKSEDADSMNAQVGKSCPSAGQPDDALSELPFDPEIGLAHQPNDPSATVYQTLTTSSETPISNNLTSLPNDSPVPEPITPDRPASRPLEPDGDADQMDSEGKDRLGSLKMEWVEPHASTRPKRRVRNSTRQGDRRRGSKSSNKTRTDKSSSASRQRDRGVRSAPQSAKSDRERKSKVSKRKKMSTLTLKVVLLKTSKVVLLRYQRWIRSVAHLVVSLLCNYSLPISNNIKEHLCNKSS